MDTASGPRPHRLHHPAWEPERRIVVVFPALPRDVLESRYELSAHHPDQMPDADPDCPEIAFAGRSNVGKSSLINALIGRKGLARTSNTPGKTRALNSYLLRVRRGESEGNLRLVDLPGYGYAKVSKAERRQWAPLVEGYLIERPSLWGVVLIVDGRRPPMDSDIQMADWLGQHGVHFLATLTKSDKLKQSERPKVLRDSEGLLRSIGARHVLQISATRGTGIHELWPLLEEVGRDG